MYKKFEKRSGRRADLIFVTRDPEDIKIFPVMETFDHDLFPPTPPGKRWLCTGKTVTIEKKYETGFEWLKITIEIVCILGKWNKDFFGK